MCIIINTEIAVVSNKCDKYITHNICRRIGKTIWKTKQPTRHTNRPNVVARCKPFVLLSQALLVWMKDEAKQFTDTIQHTMLSTASKQSSLSEFRMKKCIQYCVVNIVVKLCLCKKYIKWCEIDTKQYQK